MPWSPGSCDTEDAAGLPSGCAHRYRGRVPLAPHVRLALSQTAAPFTEAAPLPREVLTDPAFFAMDRDLFAASWIPVAHESELARPGQFVAAEIAGERVLVVRGADLEVHAFLDRCLHRGTPLTSGESGLLPTLELVCPYHGLRYDLGGKVEPHTGRALGLAAGAPPAARADRAARAVRARVPVARFAAVRRADGARAAVAPPRGPAHAPPRAAPRPRGRRELEARRGELPGVAPLPARPPAPGSAHPVPALPASRSAAGGSAGRWTSEGGAETVSDDGQLAGRPLLAHPDDLGRVFDALLFPAWLTSLQPDYLLSYRLVPRAPDRTTVIADIFFHEAARAADADPHSVYSFWDRTNAEDRAICERQQRGVRSRAFAPAGYARGEDGRTRLRSPRRSRATSKPSRPKRRKLKTTKPRTPRHRPRNAPTSSSASSASPFIDLVHLLDDRRARRDRRRDHAWPRARRRRPYTGGSLKWMGVVAPWVMDDGYLDSCTPSSR